MKNSEQPAFPFEYITDVEDGTKGIMPGLTKREYFAGLAMQAILSNRDLQLAIFQDIKNDQKMYPGIDNFNAICKHAVREADELLKQLDSIPADTNP